MGIGLTPSADDVMLGISAWLYFYPGAYKKYVVWFKCLKEFLDIEGEKRTTLVSKIYLEYGSEGYFSDILYKLILSIISQKKNDVIAAANSMIGYGASSGCDICAGVLIGSAITSNKIFEMV
jgi:hypothetical protein